MVEEWLESGRLQGQAERTATLRRDLMGRLQWFLDRNQAAVCGGFELRRFFTHLMDGYKLPDGRWGCGAAQKGKQELSSDLHPEKYLI